MADPSSFQSRRLFHSHPRLMSALLIGFFTGAVLPRSWGLTLKILIGWNTAIWIYLALTSWLIVYGSARRIVRLAQQEDANAIFALAVMSFGAVASLAAIIIELGSAKNLSGAMQLFHYGLTCTTVLGSWLLVSVMYSFHYAHLYYRSHGGAKPISFPGDFCTPGYWDFLYFSFTIAVAAQTSDISIMSTSVRKTVLAQSILAFIFNAAIIGMSINIAAGVVTG